MTPIWTDPPEPGLSLTDSGYCLLERGEHGEIFVTKLSYSKAFGMLLDAAVTLRLALLDVRANQDAALRQTDWLEKLKPTETKL